MIRFGRMDSWQFKDDICFVKFTVEKVSSINHMSTNLLVLGE